MSFTGQFREDDGEPRRFGGNSFSGRGGSLDGLDENVIPSGSQEPFPASLMNDLEHLLQPSQERDGTPSPAPTLPPPSPRPSDPFASSVMENHSSGKVRKGREFFENLTKQHAIPPPPAKSKPFSASASHHHSGGKGDAYFRSMGINPAQPSSSKSLSCQGKKVREIEDDDEEEDEEDEKSVMNDLSENLDKKLSVKSRRNTDDLVVKSHAKKVALSKSKVFIDKSMFEALLNLPGPDVTAFFKKRMDGRNYHLTIQGWTLNMTILLELSQLIHVEKIVLEDCLYSRDGYDSPKLPWMYKLGTVSRVGAYRFLSRFMYARFAKTGEVMEVNIEPDSDAAQQEWSRAEKLLTRTKDHLNAKKNAKGLLTLYLDEFTEATDNEMFLLEAALQRYVSARNAKSVINLRIYIGSEVTSRATKNPGRFIVVMSKFIEDLFMKKVPNTFELVYLADDEPMMRKAMNSILQCMLIRFSKRYKGSEGMVDLHVPEDLVAIFESFTEELKANVYPVEENMMEESKKRSSKAMAMETTSASSSSPDEVSKALQKAKLERAKNVKRTSPDDAEPKKKANEMSPGEARKADREEREEEEGEAPKKAKTDDEMRFKDLDFREEANVQMCLHRLKNEDISGKTAIYFKNCWFDPSFLCLLKNNKPGKLETIETRECVAITKNDSSMLSKDMSSKIWKELGIGSREALTEIYDYVSRFKNKTPIALKVGRLEFLYKQLQNELARRHKLIYEMYFTSTNEGQGGDEINLSELDGKFKMTPYEFHTFTQEYLAKKKPKVTRVSVTIEMKNENFILGLGSQKWSLKDDIAQWIGYGVSTFIAIVHEGKYEIPMDQVEEVRSLKQHGCGVEVAGVVEKTLSFTVTRKAI